MSGGLLTAKISVLRDFCTPWVAIQTETVIEIYDDNDATIAIDGREKGVRP